MNKQLRNYEELVALQDKAITALTQANLALQLALEAIQAARNEHGFLKPLPGLGVGAPVILPPQTTPSIPWNQPQVQPQWGNGDTFIWSTIGQAQSQAQGQAQTQKAQKATISAQQMNQEATAFVKSYLGGVE